MPNLKVAKIKLEKLFRKAGNMFGVDVKMTDEENMLLQINYNKIDLIFDIGANEGQFGEMIYKLGYKGRMISFEPLTDAYNKLRSRIKKFNNWDAPERCAIGDTDGEIEINVSGNSISSSILEMNELHSSNAADSAYIRKEKTPIRRLDTIGTELIKNEKNILLKIDTQGAEEKVLKGAAEFLDKVKGLIVEMSLVELYKGQALFQDVCKMLEQRGFRLTGIETAFINKNSGRVYQVDGIFFKE